MTKKGTTQHARTSPKGQPLPVLSFATARAFSTWLARHHADTAGIWLKLQKAKDGRRAFGYTEALEEALCWGWIDGQKQRHDEAAWLQRFSPRRARSGWSKINCDRALELIQAGRMQPPGLAQVQAAQRDGRWAKAYDSPRTATVPADLAAALAKNARAKVFFSTLDARNRYAVLYRLQTAKTEKTRAERVEKFVTMLGRHEKIHG